jgi:hypothetical protein
MKLSPGKNMSQEYEFVSNFYSELFYSDVAPYVEDYSKNFLDDEKLIKQLGSGIYRLEKFARLLLFYTVGKNSLTEKDRTKFNKHFIRILLLEIKWSLAQKNSAWPKPGIRNQALVEAGIISFSLTLDTDNILNLLNQADKQFIVSWLSLGLVEDRWKNNWVIFPGLIDSCLHKLTGKKPSGHASKSMEVADGWYLGEGMYSDGKGHKLDYYNAWSFHLFLPFIALWNQNPDKLETYIDRIKLYQEVLLASIDDYGAPIYQGRSLIYRFAMLAPLWVPHLVQSKDTQKQSAVITAKTMNYFWKNGAAPNGRLVPGWLGRNEKIMQSYSNDSSLYWSSFGFLGLMLNKDSDIWNVSISKYTSDDTKQVNLKNLNVLKKNGISILHSPRNNHKFYNLSDEENFSSLYNRLFYSSVTAPVESPTFLIENQVYVNGKKTHVLASENPQGDQISGLIINYLVWQRAVCRIVKMISKLESWKLFPRMMQVIIGRCALRQEIYWSENEQVRSLYSGKKTIKGDLKITYWPISNASKQMPFDENCVEISNEHVRQRLQIAKKNILSVEMFTSTIENPFGNNISLPVEIIEKGNHFGNIASTRILFSRLK